MYIPKPKLFNRKSLRLKGYDYSKAGSYFITICCQDKKYRFGHVENEKMILNEFGEIAHNEWIKLADRFPNFAMDTFQIMPNHMHSIITLREGSTLAVDPTATARVDPTTRVAPTTIPDIVGAYKSLVANRCLEIYKSKNQMMGKFWQRSYFERIIRNERAFKNITNYIINNPAKWSRDAFNKR